MILLKLFLFGVILPVLVSGVILLLAWRLENIAIIVRSRPLVSGVILLLLQRPWRRDAQNTGGAWAGGLALGAGYIVGHAGVIGWPPFPPVEATQWLVYLAIAASAVGLLEARWGRSTWVRWGVRLLLLGMTLWLLLRPMLKHNWGPGEAVAWLAGLGIALLLFWGGLDALVKRLSGVSLPLTLLIVAAGGSVVLGLSGSLLLGQLEGALAAALGVSLVVAWWRPAMSLARSALPVVTVLLAGLWMAGYFYAQVPAASALLLAVAPMAAWVGQIPSMRRAAPWQVNLARAAGVLIPVLLAVLLAISASSSNGYGY
ncbi:hypothetical protein HYR99_05885 [Candidatus Poribacteria bacterium]|nr:hypothetical protein [Candidatus Poribacteria bacterium]